MAVEIKSMLPNNKKMSILCILQVLKEYSDENHLLTQAQIIKIISEQYGLELERKSISSNIESLQDFGFDIVNTGKGYYLGKREFENSELKLLIDSVLYSKHINTEQAKKLIEKLKKIGSKYFKEMSGDIYNINYVYHTDSKDIFDVINTLTKAIKEKCQVSFVMNEFNIDEKTSEVMNSIIGEVKTNPYRLVYSNGFYYLLGSLENEKRLTSYRLDKISNIKLLESKIGTNRELNTNDISLGSYINSHPYLLSVGQTENIKVLINKEDIGLIIDNFGKNINISRKEKDLWEVENKDDYIVSFTANSEDVKLWALNNADKVEILSPQQIRDELRITINNLNEKYLDTDDDKYNEEIARVHRFNELIENGELSYIQLHFRLVDLRNKEEYKTLKNISGAIFEYNNISDFSFLENYNDLKYLKINKSNVSDLSVISKLKRLQKLDIESTEIDNLDFLENLEDLRVLCLDENTNIKDYSQICKLKYLEYLAITSYELNYINIDKIKEKFPNLTLYVGNPVYFDEMTGINYRIDINYVIKKDEWTFKLLNDIFGIFYSSRFKENKKIEQVKNNCLIQKEDISKTFDLVIKDLSPNEQRIAEYIYKKEKSLKEISKLENIPIDRIIEHFNSFKRFIREPKTASLFKRFIE